jgi:methyl acetate hydrolase
MQKIEKILQSAIATKTAAGLAAAITSPTETIFQSTAGTLAFGNNIPITPDTQFWIASMTKPITSIAAMQLVEQGKLNLDTPIADLLPALANPQILQNGALHPARTKITLRHLLTHTSGFTYSFASAELAAYLAANNLTAAPGQRASLNMPLLHEPGAAWTYGISTDWAGQAIEAASGQPLDAYLKTNIFDPLNMTRTTFMPGLENRAGLHQRQPDGSLTPIPITPAKKPEFFSGGGGLYSTLSDYQKFLRMFLQNGAGLVSPATIAAMSTNQIGPLRAGTIPSAQPSLIADMDVYPGQDSKWSLGFLLNPQKGPFGRSPNSLNWAGIANTYFWIDPAANLAAVFMSQVFPSGDPAVMKTYFAFESAIYAASH